MADHTITLAETDEKILLTRWESVEAALAHIIGRQLEVLGKEAVYQSSSEKDPRKMSMAEIRTELDSLGKEIDNIKTEV